MPVLAVAQSLTVPSLYDAVPRCVFGGVQTPLVIACPPGATRLMWHLRNNTRTIARGEAEVAAGVARVALPVPPVHPGIVLPTQLDLNIVDAARAVLVADTRDVAVCAAEPFVPSAARDAEPAVDLYDPAGRTAAALEATGYPVRSLRSLAAHRPAERDLLILGEGLDLAAERGFAAQLDDLLQQGARVLCLAPAAGTLPLPALQHTSRRGAGQRVAFEDASWLQALDPRLDPVPVAGFGLRMGRADILAEFDAQHGPWAVLDQRVGAGRLLIVRAQLLGGWDAAPAPRYLFKALVKELGEPPGQGPKKESGR